MKTYDRIGAISWLSFSLFACVASIRLEVGSPRNPGISFLAFGASILLMVFSLIILIQSFLTGKDTKQEAAPPSTLAWHRPLFGAIGILAFGMVLEFLGYLITTFLLMSFLFWMLKGTRWWVVLTLSLLSTVLTYYVFSKLLSCSLPRGLFGF